ncbi:hypothetical protein [Gluconacetobacter takamatsuzukensis]|uniref:Uncharacterized protein n=1 Tax=Gluconacetobacter takamatsuzukensis TaxID=1286190 RepID=A0A7W4KF72_9PROT|nr:hypothetical protein [Gluconacetobacter takamatsuzukensis]MBB2205879.1 hypothetical protein [Gluconacetobacter takamatsuzukensis]
MKKFDFPLDAFQASRLVGSFRGKKDVIALWMNAIKLISVYAEPTKAQVSGHLVLHVDKMSRLFIETGTKSFSVSFPFSIYEKDYGLEFGTSACPEVDSKVTSDILSLINGQDVFSSGSVYEFADPLIELTGDQDLVWQLLRDLMLVDDGYIRIDHDSDNENGALHPLDHIDIFYSQAATFKIGLGGRVGLDAFHDILSIKSNCYYLGPAK